MFEALRSDHDTPRTLIDILVKTTGDSEGRREIFAKVQRELTAHAAAEERFFCVPLMESDTTQEQARSDRRETEHVDVLEIH